MLSRKMFKTICLALLCKLLITCTKIPYFTFDVPGFSVFGSLICALVRISQIGAVTHNAIIIFGGIELDRLFIGPSLQVGQFSLKF